VKRDLAALADRSFDLAVIGGGIVGASIARDAARRGLAVALVEKEDFGSATSEAMSHMIHGGIRYLAQGDTRQVRLSLAERAVWRRIAPHQVTVQPCMVPLIGSLPHRLFLRAGVMLFNALGGRNVLSRKERVPLVLGRREALAAEPAIDQPGLAGALIYHDCRVDEPERVVLGVVKSAWRAGATVANHLECEGLLLRAGAVEGVAVLDRIGREKFTVRASAVINATGAWAGVVAGRLLTGQQQVTLTLSKGIHLVVRSIVGRYSLTLAGKHEHGFVLPWRGMSLVGTTDNVVSGDPGEVRVEPADVEQLTAKIARLLPASATALGSPVATFAGVRALPGQGVDSYRMSRDGAFNDHVSDGASGFFSVFGGKWTIARLMAEGAVDQVGKYLQRSMRPCDTAATPLEDAPDGPLEAVSKDWCKRLVGCEDGDVAALVAAYGRSLPEVLAHLDEVQAPPGFDALEHARFSHAASHEMAVTADDFVRRLARWHAIRNPGVAERASQWLASRRNLTHGSGME
jgi:glycerol-3-phosphate dehydrogenase